MKYKTSNENVKVDYHVDDNELILELIEVSHELRGQGLADSELHKFMRWGIDNSDELGVDCITLACYPQDDETDQDRLAELYLAAGFEWDEGDLMIYKI